MRRCAGLIVLASCGRIGFDDVGARGDGDLDMLGGDTADSPSAGPSKCSQITVAMCDGFESGLDPRWTTDLSAGVALPDMTRAYRGNVSMHFHTDPVNAGTTPFATLRTNQGLGGAITGTAYARAWVYYPTGHPTNVFDQAVNFVDNGGSGISLGWRNGFVRSNDYKYQQSAISATAPLPLDRWVCVQLQVPSAIEGTTRLFVDGVEATDVVLTTPVGMPQPAADHIYFGIDWITNTVAMPATDAWFDELIIDSAPTTCAQ